MSELWAEAIHPQQERRYYSCLIERSCKKAHTSNSAFRVPLYRIELPGYPILSDGKADNQIFGSGSSVTEDLFKDLLNDLKCNIN